MQPIVCITVALRRLQQPKHSGHGAVQTSEVSSQAKIALIFYYDYVALDVPVRCSSPMQLIQKHEGFSSPLVCGQLWVQG